MVYMTFEKNVGFYKQNNAPDRDKMIDTVSYIVLIFLN